MQAFRSSRTSVTSIEAEAALYSFVSVEAIVSRSKRAFHRLPFTECLSLSAFHYAACYLAIIFSLEQNDTTWQPVGVSAPSAISCHRNAVL